MKAKNISKRLTKKSINVLSLAFFMTIAGVASAGTSFPTLPISNIPLISVQYGAPDILFVLDNSQSMAGNLSGAIMTGSGTVKESGQYLENSKINNSCYYSRRYQDYVCTVTNNINSNSSSPINFTVPQGFTPPVSGGSVGDSEPYTVTETGANGSQVEVDNSPSRLNIAKAAIEQAYTQWNSSMNFGLMDYQVQGTPSYDQTWVYYMSGPNGFVFHNSQPSSSSGYIAVSNPCYYQNTQATQSCQDIRSFIGSGNGAFSKQFVWVSASSDNPQINDVLYASGESSNLIFSSPYAQYGRNTYNIPGNGYPPNTPYTVFGLSAYNNNNIYVQYSNASSGYPFGTSPTNAGYVPYSQEVWYSERGFGYDNTLTGNGNLVVPIASSNTDSSDFSAALSPETSDPNTAEIKADAVNAPMAGTLKSAYQYLTGNSLPTTCNSRKYVILLTDGLPTYGDVNGYLWPPLGSAAAKGYGVYANFNSDGTISSTNDGALKDTIQAIDTLSQSGIKTYVVGLGAGVDTSADPAAAATLKAMAIAGGTHDYIAAETPAALSRALSTILQGIEAQQSTTGVSLNSSSQSSNSLVYQASYVTNLWTGNLKAETLSSILSDASSPTVQWQATGDFPAGTLTTSSFQDGTDPNVFTWNPSASNTGANNGSGYGEPFSWSSLSTNQQQELEYGFSQLSQTQQSSFSQGAAGYGQGVMQWLLNGNTSNGIFRSPISLMADIVNSTPLFVGLPDSGNLSSSYQQFVDTVSASASGSTPMVYVGSNGGLLYGFNANTGQPEFAFVPDGGIYSRLSALPQPSYSHQFYVDGSPVESSIQMSNGQWERLLTGGLDDGGDSIYGLNVTYPTQFNANDVLWNFTNPNLGLTYSQPQITEVDDNGQPTWVVIFGSGYNSPSGQPYLFIVNAENGNLIDAVDLENYAPASDFNTSQPEGVSTPALASDDSGFISGLAYVGDLQGNLWRVNIQQLLNPDSGQTTAPVSVLYHATTTNSSGQTVPAPITIKPLVTPTPNGVPSGNLVIFGTGELLNTSDLVNTNVQTIYGVLDNGSGATVLQSQLAQRNVDGANDQGQTIIVPSGSSAVTPVNWSTQRGWYIPLSGANLPTGLRSISNMDLNMNRLIFTIYAPASENTCGGSGQSYLMILNYLQGSTFSQPEFFAGSNFSNPLESNNQNAMGVSLGKQYAGTPTQAGQHLLVPLGNGTIKAITLPSLPVSPFGWRNLL